MAKNNTPLRYPGGKQKLAPFIMEILSCNSITDNYAEPFAGGAGVAIELLLNKKIKNIHLNDSDIGIYAFWHCVKNENEKLCRNITTASLTIEEWKRRKYIIQHPQDYDLFELGYSVFYLNRCNRSGVLSAGVIGGLSQSGNYKMDARFPRNELIRRVEAIGLFAESISITNMDAEVYIQDYVSHLSSNTLVYLDPPYYYKSKALYLNSYENNDHLELSLSIKNNIKQPWVLSYDAVSEIINLYSDRRYFIYDLQYSASRSYIGKEIFIFGDHVEIPTKSRLQNIQSALELITSDSLSI
ncbi:DNA adenine methylase [Proteiniphilum sp.]|uniref:DNA adenine methylase n=1 Tax=Proteiniphilum sp. TaxID=1926877 RepID=UPI0033276D0A